MPVWRNPCPQSAPLTPERYASAYC
jgi:hypothetical protein